VSLKVLHFAKEHNGGRVAVDVFKDIFSRLSWLNSDY
jgi:hypothetical protein